jgi:hypothetical protein
MYVATPDKNNVVSFITGYEIGSTCDFSNLFKSFIADKFKIPSGATGWPGQIERLAEKLSQSWSQTFKQVFLHFITYSNIDDIKEELNRSIKTRIQGLIERIDIKGDPCFNEWWIEEWRSLCAVDFEWFKQLWTSEKLKIVQAIDKAIASNEVFSDDKNFLPTKELILLKGQFKA